MSGQAGGRGYLIQAIIAVLDALQESDWTECVVEPSVGEDKIDLLLRCLDGDRVSQIKSSQNAIGAANVRKWAEELEAAYPRAKQYELRLIGPVTSAVTSAARVGNVDVPVPEALNIRALIERCAHRLDRYLRGLGHGPTRPAAREMLAEALATRIATFSADRSALSRHALEELFATWVAELLPHDASDNTQLPRQLPGSPADFVGRRDELAVVSAVAERDGERVLIVRGLTGVGKSVFAARAAGEIEHRYPDGQVYVNLRGGDIGPHQVTRVLADVIQAFMPTYPSSDDLARCQADFRTLLNDRRVLILAESVDAADQVEALIPPTSDSLLIITTQSRFDLPGAVSVDLDVLPEEDATMLARLIAPRVTDAAVLLARMCGYLPLAIRIACGTLNARPDLSVEEYVDRLSGVSERANLVRATLDVSLAHVTAETRRLLTATTAFPVDFDADGIAAVCGQPTDVTDTQLAAAIGRHLIQWDENRQRYTLHDLIRAYVTDTSEAADCSLFATRHAQYYSELCSHVDALYRDGGESVFSALNLFDTELVNIAAGFYFSANHASSEKSAAETCTAFVRGLTHVMDLRLSPLARLQVLLAGLTAAKTIGDVGLVVLHTGNLGRVYRELGDLDLSIECHRRVLQMATDAGHPQDQAYAYHHIGLAHLDKKEFIAGIDHLEKALAISRESSLGLKSLEMSTLNNLGVAYLKTNQPGKALGYLRPAFDLQNPPLDPRMLALTMTNIGTALVATKTEAALAIEMLEKAIGIAEDLDDWRTQFGARVQLAQALAESGRLDEALAKAKAQQAEAASIGYQGFEIDALRTVGDIHLAMGDIPAARASYEELAQIASDRCDPDAERKAVGGMAELALRQGDNATALRFLEKRLEIASGPQDKAAVAWRLGELLASEGNGDRAGALMRQALEYYLSINHEGVDVMRERIRVVEAGTGKS